MRDAGKRYEIHWQQYCLCGLGGKVDLPLKKESSYNVSLEGQKRNDSNLVEASLTNMVDRIE